MMRLWILMLLCLLSHSVTSADEAILTARSGYNFDTSLQLLQDTIKANGYVVSHVQRCDGGLEKAGYPTDLYRIVFFGKLEEVRKLSHEVPALIPLLPLKRLIYAENDQTIVSIINPEALPELDPQLAEAESYFRQWRVDFEHILQTMREPGHQAAAH